MWIDYHDILWWIRCWSGNSQITFWGLSPKIGGSVPTLIFAPIGGAETYHVQAMLLLSVVTVAGICNSVGGGVILTCYCGGGGKYQSVSRLGMLIGNRWMSWLVVLECTNCSLHATVDGALCETVATVSLSTVPRLSLLPADVRFASGEAYVWGRAGGIAADWSRRAFTFTQGSNDTA